MKRIILFVLMMLAVWMPAVVADEVGGAAEILKTSPTDLGYTNVPNWLQFPPAEHPDWEFDGVVAGVAVDSRDNVYVSHRGNSAPRLTVWKPDGSFIRIFPGLRPTRPHMVNIDKEDNVWLVDDGGHCIRKMDQEGKVLLTLGEPGVKGFDNYHYNHPTDIGWDLSGNLYVTDGDNSESESENRRVLKYDKNGKFIKKWGSIGQGIGQFDYPHSILVDSKETVFVCDRNNWRIQVFDTDGNQEANWKHIGRVYKMCEDKNGDYFVSDGRVGRITKFKRDGTVIGFFETPDKGPGERGGLNNAHSLAICSNGDLITGTYEGWVERWKAPMDGHEQRFSKNVTALTTKRTKKMDSLMAPSATVQKLAGGFRFTEGPGKWTMLACTGQPDGRHETTFVEYQGKFYLIGGRESRKIDRFNPQTKVWTKMKATSPLIHHFQPVLWDNKIYMVGAMTGNYPKEPPMSHIQIYDPLRDEWTEGGEIPEARQRGSAGTVLYKGKIYMVGGITLGHTSGTNNWFDEYDPATDTWKVLPDAPHIRDHFHAVVLDDKLYCIGGRNTSYHEPGNFTAFFGAVTREIDCYDFKTKTWTTLKAKLPVGSAAGGVAVLNGKIIYFGGETAQKGPALNRTWAFDLQTETWMELANLNQGRHGSQAIVYDNKVYIAAGSPNRGGGRTNTIEMFSFKNLRKEEK